MGALAGLQTLGANVFPRKSPFTHGTGGGYPPPGFIWLLDDDGEQLLDDDNEPLYEEI